MGFELNFDLISDFMLIFWYFGCSIHLVGLIHIGFLSVWISNTFEGNFIWAHFWTQNVLKKTSVIVI